MKVRSSDETQSQPKSGATFQEPKLEPTPIAADPAEFDVKTQERLTAILSNKKALRDELRNRLRDLSSVIESIEAVLRHYGVAFAADTTPGNVSQKPPRTQELAEMIFVETGNRPLTSRELVHFMKLKGRIFRGKRPEDSVYVILKRSPYKFRFRNGKWTMRPIEDEMGPVVALEEVAHEAKSPPSKAKPRKSEIGRKGMLSNSNAAE